MQNANQEIKSGMRNIFNGVDIKSLADILCLLKRENVLKAKIGDLEIEFRSSSELKEPDKTKAVEQTEEERNKQEAELLFQASG